MKTFSELQESLKNKKDPCWKGYQQVGMKKKNGKEVPNCVPKEEVEEGKLPPHLSKFFDKDGNLNKDAEERVKQGRKKRGLDPRTGKKLKSVNEARKYSVLDTKKNEIVSRPNITKAAAQKLVDKDPDNRIMGSPEFIHDKRTNALKENYGARSKRAFKRQEHEFEAEMDRKADAKRKADDAMTRVIWIDGKVWKKNGKPVEFKDKRHAQNVIKSMMKKNPEKKFVSGSMDYYKQEGDKLKESVNESKDVFFDSYSSAISHALDQAKKKGYEVDEDDVFREITTGQGKPGRGKTVRHTLKLTKGGKPQRKALQIQVYNRETAKNTFELNFYIS